MIHERLHFVNNMLHLEIGQQKVGCGKRLTLLGIRWVREGVFSHSFAPSESRYWVVKPYTRPVKMGSILTSGERKGLF